MVGSGPKTIFDDKAMKRLGSLGVESPTDLLFLPPVRYYDYRQPEPGFAAAHQHGQWGYFKVKALTSTRVREASNGKPAMAFLSVTDGVDSASICVFGQVFAWRSVRSGAFIHTAGKVGIWEGRYSLRPAELVPPEHQGRIVPVYPGKKKVIAPASVGRYVTHALNLCMDEAIGKTLSRIGLDENELLQRIGSPFPSLERLFRTLHYPRQPDEVQQALDAIRRISALEKVTNREGAKESHVPVAGVALHFGDDLLRDLVGSVPFPLTGDQRRCTWEICKDLRAPEPMDRVLTGDVGSGKTIVYGIPAAAAQISGYQVIIMMPNTLLAEQVKAEIDESFPRCRTALMVSGHEHVGPLNGNPIIVGTSAILHWMKALDAPLTIDLLIIDEQQKFSAEQRSLMSGVRINRLEASATPIPRTAALMRYGGKRISRIQTLPVTKHIDSVLIAPGERSKVMSAIDGALAAGDQAAVLYPMRKTDAEAHRVALCEGRPCDVTPAEVLRAHRVRDAQSCEETDRDDVCAALGRRDIAVFQYVLSPERNEALIADLRQKFGDKNVIYLGTNQSFVDKRNAIVAKNLFERRYPGQVALLHGGLSQDDKVGAIRDVKAGRYGIVVTTSVVEIGITIPRLRVVHVTDATVYGANTLHQIRGRLARKGGRGLFFMGIPRAFEHLAEKTQRRLATLLETNDGFEIAERELRERGFGDLSRAGEMQSGYHDGLFSGIRVTADDVEDVMG